MILAHPMLRILRQFRRHRGMLAGGNEGLIIARIEVNMVDAPRDDVETDDDELVPVHLVHLDFELKVVVDVARPLPRAWPAGRPGLIRLIIQ